MVRLSRSIGSGGVRSAAAREGSMTARVGGIAAAIAVLCTAAAAEARKHVVRSGESIRDAIAQARAGDRIEVQPGVYHEGRPGDLNALTITIDGIELVGKPRPGRPVVLENAGNQSFGVWVSPANSAGPGPEADPERPPCGWGCSRRHKFRIHGVTLRGVKVLRRPLACARDFRIGGHGAEWDRGYCA